MPESGVSKACEAERAAKSGEQARGPQHEVRFPLWRKPHLEGFRQEVCKQIRRRLLVLASSDR